MVCELIPPAGTHHGSRRWFCFIRLFADGDGFGLRFLSLGQRDGQDAVLVLRLHLVARDRRWQRERAGKFSVEPLLPVDFRVFVNRLGLAFTGDDQCAVELNSAHRDRHRKGVVR